MPSEAKKEKSVLSPLRNYLRFWLFSANEKAATSQSALMAPMIFDRMMPDLLI